MFRRLEEKVTAAILVDLPGRPRLQQVVCVTGASGAIGAEIVRAVLAQGMHASLAKSHVILYPMPEKSAQLHARFTA